MDQNLKERALPPIESSNYDLCNTSGLHPRGRAVLIKTYEIEKVRSSVIELPAHVKGRQDLVEQRGIVLEVGPSAWHDEPMPRAFPGEHVLFTRFAGFMAAEDVTADGQRYRLVNDNDIFCVIDAKEQE